MRTRAHIRKIALSQSRRREVMIDGQLYISVSEAATAFKISRSAVLYRIKHWANWNYNVNKETEAIQETDSKLSTQTNSY